MKLLHSQSVTYTKYSTEKRWNRIGLDHWWRPDYDPQMGFRSIDAQSLSEPFKSDIVLHAKDYQDGTKITISTTVDVSEEPHDTSEAR